MERLVSSRLIHLLEAGNKLAPCQAGFRKGRITEEQLARITQDIFDGLEEQAPRKSVLVLLDYPAACDRVWKNALEKKLAYLVVPVIRWLKGFLNQWRARVNWKNTLRVQRRPLPGWSSDFQCNDLRILGQEAAPTPNLASSRTILLPSEPTGPSTSPPPELNLLWRYWALVRQVESQP